MQEAGGDDLFGDIVQDFKAGISDEESKDAEAHFNLGVAYREIASTEEAIAEFERALALGDPTMEFAINKHLGECYSEIGQDAQAAQYLESALDADEEDINEQEKLDLMVDLGELLIKLGENRRAVELLTEVDRLNSNYRGSKNMLKEAKKKSKNEKKKKKKGGGEDDIGYV
jgi:tetratricopeptide (TPR) repeat protein